MFFSLFVLLHNFWNRSREAQVEELAFPVLSRARASSAHRPRFVLAVALAVVNALRHLKGQLRPDPLAVSLCRHMSEFDYFVSAGLRLVSLQEHFQIAAPWSESDIL